MKLPARLVRLVVVGLAALLMAVPEAPAEPCAPPPSVLQLPPGFAPEGIASGRHHRLFVSSIKDGSIHALDARTGVGTVLVAPLDPPGQALGMKVDPRTNHLFVAGGNTGGVRVYDADTGALLADVALTNVRPTFVNDVLITERAVYLTESIRPALYRLPLARDGHLVDDPPTEVALGGDFQFLPGKLNSNGIAQSPQQGHVLVVNTSSGGLYDVDPQTGVGVTVAVEGGPLTNADGLLGHGRTLYVVQNLLNRITVLTLSRDARQAKLVRTVTSPNLDIPTTAAALDGGLYIVNARYTTPYTPTNPYTVARIDAGRSQ